MKLNWKKWSVCIAIPLAVGGVSALISRGAMESFGELRMPPLAPPAWLFPVVWTILYILMGIASCLVRASDKPNQKALRVYALQLAVNFFWPILFFNLELYLAAFFWLVLLWVLVLVTTELFYGISKPAGLLMIPYLLWITFAGYLNLTIYLLNRG